MTDTPETDELVRKYMTEIGTDAIGMASKLTLKCMDLERERDEAREQRDAFIKEIEIANERLRGKKHPDDNGIMAAGEIDIKQLLEQRDGLKSAVDCASDLLDAAIAERDKWRDRYEIANAEHGEAVEQLSEWRILNLWGGTPELIHEFIKGQQDRIHHAQNVEKELAAEIDELRRTNEGLNLTFDLRWKADQRAIKRWQDAHPNNQLTWPDHADLVVWLLENYYNKSNPLTNLPK